MQGRRAEDRAAAELRELVAQLERRGLAERRADVRQLLANSRSLLLARQSPIPRAGPPPRELPSAWKLAGKLGALLAFASDAAVLAGSLWGSWSALAQAGAPWSAAIWPDIALALLGPGWILLRLPAAREGLREACCWLSYHLAWGYDWFAEAFSRRAMHRLSTRLVAREVMWAWRQHARSLPRRPGPAEVEAFLAEAYGARAAAAFGRATAQLGRGDWSLRGRARIRSRAAGRLEALRWSVLIRLFAGLAVSGALWAEPEAMPDPPVEVPVPDVAPAPAESPALDQRRMELRELIRRKRQDITTAYGWKLKTEAEIVQRDAYLRQTRREIVEMEQELAGLDM